MRHGPVIIASADCWGPKLRSRTVLGLSRFLPWAVLALCCTVFLLTARRGLDLTDESFYLVSCRDWRTTFSTSLFGAYLGGPFHLLGENIAAFRVFGAGLLLVSAWHFFWALDRLLFPGVPDNGGRPAGRIEFLGAGVASIFSFYALEPTLRVPSYNLLVLVCLMSSTGFLLTVLAGPRDRKATASLTLGGAYGATLSILAFTFTMVTGGNDTTTGLLGGAVQLLDGNPDQRRLLVGDPDLIPDAVEEFLRLTSPVQGLARTTTGDVALHDTTIPAGRKVLLLYASANRDERQYGPDAAELDVTRRPRNILTFSHGAHHCLGAAAARMQSRVALTELLARCPDFEVDSGGIVWAGGSYVRRPLSVPVRIGR